MLGGMLGSPSSQARLRAFPIDHRTERGVVDHQNFAGIQPIGMHALFAHARCQQLRRPHFTQALHVVEQIVGRMAKQTDRPQQGVQVIPIAFQIDQCVRRGDFQQHVGRCAVALRQSIQRSFRIGG